MRDPRRTQRKKYTFLNLNYYTRFGMKYQQSISNLNSPSWYYGAWPLSETDHLLLCSGEKGHYLVTDSVDNPGSYTLSIRQTKYRVFLAYFFQFLVSGFIYLRREEHGVVHEELLRVTDGKREKFRLGGGNAAKQFTSVEKLLEHYRRHPIYYIDGEGCLGTPLPRNIRL